MSRRSDPAAVTTDHLASKLAASGMQTGEIESKRRLLDAVIRSFRPFCDGDPSHAWWIPGRVEAFGKHTDYCGGHSLVGTVPRGFATIARARGDGVVRMFDARRSEELTLRGAGAPALDVRSSYTDVQNLTGWRNYARVVVRRLARNFPGSPLGADIVFASDLPSASGMSSSSALMIGLAATLSTLADIRNRPEWRDNVRNLPEEAGYYACIENGLSFGTLAGDSGVGTHGGSEDHLAIICGLPAQLSAWTFVPIDHVDTVHVPASWTFVVASSGVAADKTGNAKEAYNRLSREAETLLAVWNRNEPPARSLQAALRSDESAAARMRDLLSRAELGAATVPTLERRLAHFLREDARVCEAMRAFRDGDRARLSALSEASQADAEILLRNQVPETAALARSARELGAFASSSFGAGFGGSVWALVEADEAAGFADRWLARHRAAFPSRSAATAFVAQPGPALTRLA
ncbi:MAG: galactokinase family protein [Vicinamibacterales bacterium]